MYRDYTQSWNRPFTMGAIQPLPPSININLYNRGLKILEAFHNTAKAYPDYNLTFDQLIEFYGKKSPFLIEGLANTADLVGFSDEKAKGYMRRFANDIKGKVPQNWMQFNNAITKYVIDPGWFETIKYVSGKTAKDVVKKGLEMSPAGIVAKTFGVKDYIGFLENVKKWAPWVIGGVAVLYTINTLTSAKRAFTGR